MAVLEDLDPLVKTLKDHIFDGARHSQVENQDFIGLLPMRSSLPIRCSTNHRIPWEVVVDERVGELQIQTFVANLRRKQDLDLRIGSKALDLLPLRSRSGSSAEVGTSPEITNALDPHLIQPAPGGRLGSF